MPLSCAHLLLGSLGIQWPFFFLHWSFIVCCRSPFYFVWYLIFWLSDQIQSPQKSFTWFVNPYLCLTINLFSRFFERHERNTSQLPYSYVDTVLDSNSLIQVAVVIYKLNNRKQPSWLLNTPFEDKLPRSLKPERLYILPWNILMRKMPQRVGYKQDTQFTGDKVNFYCIKLSNFEVTSIFVIILQWFKKCCFVWLGFWLDFHGTLVALCPFDTRDNVPMGSVPEQESLRYVFYVI